jgi:hypothetical protein
VDAWFDVMTSSGPAFGTALLMAFAAELPLAAVCGTLAVKSFPRPAGPVSRPAEPVLDAGRAHTVRRTSSISSRSGDWGRNQLTLPIHMARRAIEDCARGQQPSRRPPR